MPQYRFIDSASSSTSTSSAKSAARSHAIRTGLQGGSSRLASHSAKRSRETVLHKAQLRGRFRVTDVREPDSSSSDDGLQNSAQGQPSSGSSEVPNPSTEKRWEPSVEMVQEHNTSPVSTSLIVRHPGNHVLDPFDSLPVVRNSQVDALLKYFLTGFDLNLTTVDPRSAWFPYAMQSALTMHATVALAAAFWSTKLPSLPVAIQQEGLRQKGKGISTIMTELRERGSSSLTNDAVQDRLFLAGIASLANVETFYGDFLSADVHLRAAGAFLQSHGGLEIVHDDYVLCKCLNWNDIQLAVGLGRLPLFPAFHSLHDNPLPLCLIKAVSQPPLTHLASVADVGEEQDAQGLLRAFTVIRQAMHSQNSAISSPHTVRVLINTADTTLLNCLYGEALQDLDQSSGQRRITSLLMAGQIFLHTVLRQVPPSSALVGVLYARFRGSLGTMELVKKTWTGHFQALLWVSFVGILGAGNTARDDERQGYMSLFKWTSGNILGPFEDASDEYAGVQRILSSYLWEEKSCVPVLRNIIFPKSDHVS